MKTKPGKNERTIMCRSSKPGNQPKGAAPERATQDEVVALEADRSFLEQFEDLAVEHGSGSSADEFLTKEIYARPDRLSVLANIRGRKRIQKG